MTRRERERWEARQPPREWLAQQRPSKPFDKDDEETAIPSSYGIVTLADLCDRQHVESVVLYCRDSDRKQGLRYQQIGAYRMIREMGIEVLCSYKEFADGRKTNRRDRPELHRAVSTARRAGVPLVIPCTSRMVRGALYHAHHDPEVRPSVNEFKGFLKATEGVTVATLNDPDDDCPQDETFLRNLTATVKMKRVGRPKKKHPGQAKDRRRKWRRKAIRMKEAGMSYREIAQEIYHRDGSHVSYTTIRKWYMASLRITV
jgi:hypothetical protein